MFGSSDSRYIKPTLSLKSATSELPQFMASRLTNVSSASANGHSKSLAMSLNPSHPTPRRFVPRPDLNPKQVSYKIQVPGFSALSPLQLGGKYISDMTNIDMMTPNDLYVGELNPQDLDDNYNFAYNQGLGDFTRFEEVFSLNLPDKFFEEYNQSKANFKMGMFREINRVWLAMDNRLVLWNYQCPPLSFNHGLQFTTIDKMSHLILQVALVPPKPGVFKPEITHVLVAATTNDIHLYLVTNADNNLELYDPHLLVLVHGHSVNQLAVHPITHDIYFCEENSVSIWRIDYWNKARFGKNRCEKVCLTDSLLLGAGARFSNMWGSNSLEVPNHGMGGAESIILLKFSPSYQVVYTLLNRSTLRVYKINQKNDLHETEKLNLAQILKMVTNLYGPTLVVQTFEEFGIVGIDVVEKIELKAVQLIATTTMGCRIFFKLSQGYSVVTSSRLLVLLVKFPPSREETVENNNEMGFLTHTAQMQKKSNQYRLKVLANTKLAKVISPGIFIAVKRTKRSDKLFISTPNFGYYKKHNEMLEDAEFYSIGGGEDPTYVREVVQLNSSMINPQVAQPPVGFANVMATQYTKPPLRFAVLTNKGVKIFEYRHSNKVLLLLKNDSIEAFIGENGFEETCNTLLYLACLLTNEVAKRKALLLFALCGEPARLLEPIMPLNGPQLLQLTALTGYSSPQGVSLLSHPTADQVVLLDRFYGTCLLILRVFRDFWFQPVFSSLPYIKKTSLGAVEKNLIKLDNLLIEKLNISKLQLEFFIGTTVTLLEFFNSTGVTTILGLLVPSNLTHGDPFQLDLEICLRLEHIAFALIIKLLELIKEGLTFLMVLYEQQEQSDSKLLVEVFKGMSISAQVNLLTLSFDDILLPTREVKQLVKDLFSNIVNQKIAMGGGLIDVVTSLLKGKCELFCLADDVFIFKAIENLTKAKKIGARDQDLRDKCLLNATHFFEKAFALLSYDNVELTVDIMVDLEYYQGAVELVLKLIQKVGLVPNSSKDEDDQFKKRLYQLVFGVLTKIDLKALKLSDLDSDTLIFINQVRNPTYDLCFNCKDKDFQFSLYQWFIDQGVPERLLQVTTGPILEFITEKSHSLLKMLDLLWMYYAKHENFFDAAWILYLLAILDFDIELSQRVEFLARANGFCNCVCPPNLRQKMIELSQVVTELFDIATIQMDLVKFVESDQRISKPNRDATARTLYHSKIFLILDLFNQYADALGYYELCLVIFYVSDYKNTDDILKRWELLLEKLYTDFRQTPDKTPFFVILDGLFSEWGPKISDNDVVFPIDTLMKLVAKYVKDAIDEFGPGQKPPNGYLTNLFILLGVSYDKVQHVMRLVISFDKNFEVYPGFTKELETREVGCMIKQS